MTRKILTTAALAGCLFSVAAPAAMAADWRPVGSSTNKAALEAQCAAGKAAGNWNECDYKKIGNVWNLFVR
ncbi:hypothetical protein ABZ805_10295 [Saccharopolyspora sp. NPDC047091]|uniref:hypothetical protein n=1 Tax=Saccharopolyspora sp. NPDC047091 TaxID=3155924 RepID=UPI0033D7C6A4